MGKVLFTMQMPWGRTWTQPQGPLGRLSSIFGLCFGVRTLQSFSLPDICSRVSFHFSLGTFQTSLPLHVVNSHISFQMFFPMFSWGSSGWQSAVCVLLPQRGLQEYFNFKDFVTLKRKRFCYIFNPSDSFLIFG